MPLHTDQGKGKIESVFIAIMMTRRVTSLCRLGYEGKATVMQADLLLIVVWAHNVSILLFLPPYFNESIGQKEFLKSTCVQHLEL